MSEESQHQFSIRRVELIETGKEMTTEQLIDAARHPETIANSVAMLDILRHMADRLEICVPCGYCYNVHKQHEDDAAAKEFKPGEFEGKVGPDGRVHYSKCLNCGGDLTTQAHVWASVGSCELYPLELRDGYE